MLPYLRKIPNFFYFLLPTTNTLLGTKETLRNPLLNTEWALPRFKQMEHNQYGFHTLVVFLLSHKIMSHRSLEQGIFCIYVMHT